MTISDIITLVSLVIAVVAILSEKNRKHLLFKFHIVDLVLFASSFFLINYFVFYESFYVRGLYISQLYFMDFGLLDPKKYAYLISISSLLYFLYKIYYAFYPFSKIQNVTKFYGQLIENDEISFLLDLIDRYHKTDIIKVIDRTDDYNPEDNWWEHRFHRETLKEKIKRWYVSAIQFLFPYSWYNRRAYGVSVLHGVINDPAFIVLASNLRPYLFAEIFAHFKKTKRDGFPKELVNSFLNELVQHKNFWLKKELQQSQNNDFGQPEWFHSDNRILSALLNDLSVADVNEVWRPFGDTAVDEIEEERTKGYQSKMFNEFREEQFLWEYKTYFAIQFLKIVVIEALVKKYYDNHFWLYYYRSVTDAILKTFEKYPLNDFEEVQTEYHRFIDIMIGNCFLWLGISNDKEDKGFYNNTLSCLGSLLLAVCNSPYYSTREKVSYIKNLFSKYCNLKSNSESKKMRVKIGEIIVKPSMLTKEGAAYYEYVKIAWDKFDKIPHRGMGLVEDNDYDYFRQFKQQVIIPLGLDPNIN
ncbi:hypothetical protein [Daejeonella sp.]|uniref:hypothetical protein n=1 Tax=Daejeonella sp. TaxID=2805397 RepID=UPI0025BF7545|nr:hypothetical protein [Daejeonella sp.]